MLDTRPERSTALLAFGGGVVGDLTGFAAPSAARRPFIQIPTRFSRRSTVRSAARPASIWHGKNLVGAFYQPRLVLPTSIFCPLARRELASGYAEV